MLKASALYMYYRTKLCVHNFTVFDLKSHGVQCYVWHEAEGGLSAHEFASCIVDYLESDLSFDRYIIYSDGCTYQNRNKTLATALSRFSVMHDKEVEQKILKRGHTMMEVDSVHCVIERSIKNKKIFLPIDYVRLVEEARRKPFPYSVKYLTHTFFSNFDGVNTLSCIRPGKKAGNATVIDIRALRYLPTNGKILYKLGFGDEWSELPEKRHQSTALIASPKKLFSAIRSISNAKFKHLLQELKSVIPSECWAFYDKLKHE